MGAAACLDRPPRAHCRSGLYAYERYSAAREAIVYDTRPAEVTNLTVTVSATGTIQPITQVDVSSELSGVIRSVNVDDNSIVRKGDTLATLDTERLLAQKAKSEAQLAGAQAKLMDAEATLDQRQTAPTASRTSASVASRPSRTCNRPRLTLPAPRRRWPWRKPMPLLPGPISPSSKPT